MLKFSLLVFALLAVAALGTVLKPDTSGTASPCDAACETELSAFNDRMAAYDASPEGQAAAERRAAFKAYEEKLTATYGATYTRCIAPSRWADYEREEGTAHARCAVLTPEGQALIACLDKLPIYTPTTAERYNAEKAKCHEQFKVPAAIPDVLRAAPAMY